MAKCMFCGDDMLAVDDCSKNRTLEYTDGKVLPAIPYGSEGRAAFGRDDNGTAIPGKRCHDCNVVIGGYHHPGCDVEECPRCHHQLISCDCSLTNDVISAEQVVSKRVLSEAKIKQAEALQAAIVRGDYVRIVEDIDTGDDQDIIYAQDIQAVGRVESIDSLNTVFVAFPRGTFGFMANEVYLVDTNALHEEAAEMMAEEAAEAGQPAAEAGQPAAPTVDSEATGDSPLMAEWHKVKAAVLEELTKAQARIAELEAALTPFALAAHDKDVELAEPDAPLLIETTRYQKFGTITAGIITENEQLRVRDLRAAAKAMTDAADK